MIERRTGIYKITNLTNNKVYIGQTTNFHQRKLDHFKKTAVNQRPINLHRDMKKVGVDKFSMTLLEECSVEGLDNREKYWTDRYSKDHEMYNIVSGNPSYSSHNKKIQSKKFTKMNKENWKNPEYRKMMSQKSSERQKKRLEDPKYLAEKSAQLKKYTDSIKKRVAQYDMNGNLIKIYSGVRVAERATGIKSRNISMVANHQKYRKSAGGYRWEFV